MMTIDTLPCASLRSPGALRHAVTGQYVVLDRWHWGTALHLAALGGWSPRGALLTLPDGRTVRQSYLRMNGERLEGEDGAALATGLTAALERFLALSPAARADTEYQVRVPDSLAMTDTQVLHSRAAVNGTAWVMPFHELLILLEPERFLPPAETLTVRGLRRLAELLAPGEDWTLEATLPAGWYPPGTPTRLVRVRPRHGPPERINVGGRDAGAGELVLVSEDEALNLVGLGVAELVETPDPEEAAAA